MSSLYNTTIVTSKDIDGKCDFEALLAALGIEYEKKTYGQVTRHANPLTNTFDDEERERNKRIDEPVFCVKRSGENGARLAWALMNLPGNPYQIQEQDLIDSDEWKCNPDKNRKPHRLLDVIRLIGL